MNLCLFLSIYRKKIKSFRRRVFSFFLFFLLVFDDKAHRIGETKPRFCSITLSLFPAFRPLERRTKVYAFPQRSCSNKTAKNTCAL